MSQPIAAVTGGTGFIGRHLISELQRNNFLVRVLTRDKNMAQTLASLNAQILEGDLRDAGALSKLVDDVDYVFHLAAEIKDKCGGGTRNLLESVRANPIKRFIYLSSTGVFGHPRDFRIREETFCEPNNEYEQTKYETEKIVTEFARSHFIPATIVRPTIVFGEGKENSEDSFYQFIRQIKRGRIFTLARGRGVANYVYVKDVVCLGISFFCQRGSEPELCY